MNWSCSAEDWRLGSEAKAISRADELVNEVKARDILLFHDENLHTVVLLDRLLPVLKARGFGFSPDAELIV